MKECVKSRKLCFGKLNTFHNLVGQKTIFFGTQVQKCTCIHVKAGETLLLPGGCICEFYLDLSIKKLMMFLLINFLPFFALKLKLKNNL